MDDVNRRKFLLASGAAATGAAVAVTPKLVESITESGQPGAVVDPAHPAPGEPVMAYVHDAARGEVTVMSGTGETTYRDPALVKRLLDAAPASLEGGETGVVAP